MGVNVSNLADEIRKILDEELLTVEQFANKVGVSYSGMKKILANEYPSVHRSTVRKIAERFNRAVIIKGDKIEFRKKSEMPDYRPEDHPISEISSEDMGILEFIKSSGIRNREDLVARLKPVLTIDNKIDFRKLNALDILQSL